ncbi:MAG TPA: cyclodeaminase/cyclohydrolase family protein, partial [Enterococcus sp.]|nr:cyclodeaminase/cyclohydrolase family protein [Enterococcus sp.]
LKDALLKMVDEDTNAFNKIMDAFGLPKGTDEEKAVRKQAIQDATKFAIEVPFKVMQTVFESLQIIKKMAEIGNPNSVSDAGVGALAARSAIYGAFLNVKINASGLDDKNYVESVMSKGNDVIKQTDKLEQEILKIVESKL